MCVFVQNIPSSSLFPFLICETALGKTGRPSGRAEVFQQMVTVAYSGVEFDEQGLVLAIQRFL
ncbi:MAG TPA: hypothetical protein VFR42_08090 [Candidatus Acidoferrum sp.]|nr:hypothetical protein [Candidatus Acidoferrum sp.]